jgi:phosphohistidine swiveling domain-containing protein
VDDQRWIIDTEPSGRYPVYTRLNANDVLSDPITPLAASLAWIPQIFAGWSAGYAASGVFSAEEVVGDAAAAGGFFYGHLYVNMTTARIVGIRAGIGVAAVDAMWFGNHPDAPPHVEQPEDVNDAASERMADRTEWAMTTTTFPLLDEERGIADRLRAERPDLAALSPAALVARARSVLPLERLMWRGEVVATNNAGLGPGVLAQLLGGDDPSLVVRLVGQAGDVDSAAPSYALWDLSRLVRADSALVAAFDAGLEGLGQRLAQIDGVFSKELARFLHEFGYRGPNEWDLGSDAWETRPELVLGLIDRLRTVADSAAPASRVAAQRAEAEAAYDSAVAKLGGSDAAKTTLDAALASARRFAAWRERAKTNCIKVLHEARMPLFELGRRLQAQGLLERPQQLFMALDEELDVLALEPASVTPALLRREKQWRDLFGLDLPTFVDGGQPLPPTSSLGRLRETSVAEVAVGDVLHGVGAAPGIARGRARVVHGTDQLSDFQAGEILVAPQTDPSWTPLFMVCAAAVVDVGAMGSHAMIVSRELGIPCAAGVTGASRRIPDGALVEVDGSTGTVTVLEL